MRCRCDNKCNGLVCVAIRQFAPLVFSICLVPFAHLCFAATTPRGRLCVSFSILQYKIADRILCPPVFHNVFCSSITCFFYDGSSTLVTYKTFAFRRLTLLVKSPLRLSSLSFSNFLAIPFCAERPLAVREGRPRNSRINLPLELVEGLATGKAASSDS